jgi:hypothetical protein
MEPDRLLLMLDPTTDQIISECEGPTEEGRCPRADTPPYVCQGLRVVGAQGTAEYWLSFTVDKMVPGRCPLAWIDEATSDRVDEPPGDVSEHP